MNGAGICYADDRLVDIYAGDGTAKSRGGASRADARAPQLAGLLGVRRPVDPARRVNDAACVARGSLKSGGFD